MRLLAPLVALAFVAMMPAIVPATVQAQQVADTVYRPPIAVPTYAAGSGPRLCIDEAHHNFHTMGGRFAPFALLAARDGYRVRASSAPLSAAVLGACDILVISNAQWSDVPWAQYPYPTPSGFTAAEIDAVYEWVRGGGRLLLIADHMPLAGAAAALAERFGARFTDGFAVAAPPRDSIANPTVTAILETAPEPTLFRRDDGTLGAHAITDGRSANERITLVRSFTGQAFEWKAEGVVPLMILPDHYVSLEPRVAWQFSDSTRVRRVGRWLQGAVRELGRGRVAIFGEAAMFTAQRAGAERRPMGMNAPQAEQNFRFALNTLRWLSGG